MIRYVRWTICLLILMLCIAVCIEWTLAQSQQSYGDYYMENVGKTGPNLSPGANRYLYDKYFYQRPSVSPYINLGRPDPEGGTSYTYVRQEQQRRDYDAQAMSGYIQERKMRGDIGRTDYDFALARRGSGGPALQKQAAKPSAYYNHWYGNWANR